MACPALDDYPAGAGGAATGGGAGKPLWGKAADGAQLAFGLPAARASRGGDRGPRTAAASLLEPGARAEIAGEFLPREYSWAREHGAWGQGGAGAGGGACRGQEYGISADEAPPMAQGGTAASPPPGHGGEARDG
jgi:hypothetical protein